MFTVKELTTCVSEPWFRDGYRVLERSLLLQRLALPHEMANHATRKNMKRFSQAVISSATGWDGTRTGDARTLCQLAGDIEASLSIQDDTEAADTHLALLKAILLYEMAGLPGASASHAARNGFDSRLREFFTRRPASVWGAAAKALDVFADMASETREPSDVVSYDTLEQGLGEIAHEAGLKIQSGEALEDIQGGLRVLSQIATDFAIGVGGDDVLAWRSIINLRQSNSSLALLPALSSLSRSQIQSIAAPLELWPAQVSALKSGMLQSELKSFGFAAPTGTGKTALANILIANALIEAPGAKVLYICPSRALVHQVAIDLQNSLSGINIDVFEAKAHLTSNKQLAPAESADVLVFTPERADLLLRVDEEYLDKCCLVVVDEAHHIEQGSRGVLLEFYLWRLRKLIASPARIVQLSALAPNIGELTSWLSGGASHSSVMLDWRTNRLRVGSLYRTEKGGAALQFADETPYEILPDGYLPSDAHEGLATMANHMASNGIVLVLCMSPGIAEQVAAAVSVLRSVDQPLDDEISERLDAWIERELYPESDLRQVYRKRVVFHHAQMPPRVRLGIEEAIRARKVDVICATTTLAEGVNFPFSTVLIESLVGRSYQLSPRAMWNIAGRAGRFGIDTEGHCILFRPDLWVNKLSGYKLTDYLKSSLSDIPPVRSALAISLEKIEGLVTTGAIDLDALEEISLTNIKVDGKSTQEAKEIRAFVNIMRVGYAHAQSTKVVDLSEDTATELEKEFLASHQIDEKVKQFAVKLGCQQRGVIKRATSENEALVAIAARVGWSLEAQANLYRWLLTRENWQLEQFGNLVLGGKIRNVDTLSYLIGPVAKYLLAFEGEALGGANAFLAIKWISGVPLSSFQEERGSSFGKMVSNIYGRMQYLLPWGLFGIHELLGYEAARRGLSIQDGVSSLSVLAAEGVPNFDALSLVLGLGIERVDASRLSEVYGSRKEDKSIGDWVLAQPWQAVERIVSGGDRRRIDPALRALHRRANASA